MYSYVTMHFSPQFLSLLILYLILYHNLLEIKVTLPYFIFLTLLYTQTKGLQHNTVFVSISAYVTSKAVVGILYYLLHF